jgi:DNA-binding CsgD family transcriptional regulator
MDMLLNGELTAGSLLPGSGTGGDPGLAFLLMNELAFGVVVITLQGRLVQANQVARQELTRCRVLGAVDHQLKTACPEVARMLQEALAKAGRGKRSLVSLPVAGGAGTLTLAVLPLPGDTAGVPGHVALIFSRASVCETLMLCFFARTHGLTTTEEHVLGILCQGYSAPEIAVQMKVAVSTVRSHVRSLCAKTQSSGVRELVNRVAVLPPVAPSVVHEQMH